jgi:hypothetical protein
MPTSFLRERPFRALLSAAFDADLVIVDLNNFDQGLQTAVGSLEITQASEIFTDIIRQKAERAAQ